MSAAQKRQCTANIAVADGAAASSGRVVKPGLIAHAVGIVCVSLPLLAAAQTAPAPSPGDGATAIDQRLQRLEQRQQQLEEELKQKEAEIQALKKQQPASGSSAPAAGVAAAPASSAPPVGAAGAAAPAAASGASATERSGSAVPEPTAKAATPTSGDAYQEFLGFKVADTGKGDMRIALYSYLRYLNQNGLDPTYTDAFGNVKSVQQRQEVQLQKVQIKFLGWILDPKLRYFLYAWSSNATQGQGAQVVLAGNLTYAFKDYLALAGGITALPGVRSTEGNFPYWLSVDNRLMADEFFRPSYTSGFWLKGDITPTLRYMTMLGNNLSTLGVSSAQLDNQLNSWSSMLIWEPTTGEFGKGFGDFEDHQAVATRLGVHYTSSTESKQSQPNTDGFENTQIRLSDGSVVFTPNLFGPGIVVNNLRYRMGSLDGGIKYHGLALEGEFYYRKLDQFQGPGTEALPTFTDSGFQLQASMMAVPTTLQLYLAGSYIDGQYGNPWDIRGGVNYFPWHNRVFRWNTQVTYLDRSPVGYTSLNYNVGSKGVVFNTDFELAL